MRDLLCVCTAAAVVMSGACSSAGGRRSKSATAAAAAAESLTNALSFQNTGAKQIVGAFPPATDGAIVGLAENPPDLTGMAVKPGDPGVLTVRVVGESADDAVVATLVWMQGAASFWSLPVGGAQKGADGSVSNSFTMSQSVCKDLCNIVHQVTCYESAQTASGVITKANLTQVLLECAGSGDPAQCKSGGVPATADAGTSLADGDSGSGDSGDGSSSGDSGESDYCAVACAVTTQCKVGYDADPCGPGCAPPTGARAACADLLTVFFECLMKNACAGEPCAAEAQAAMVGGCIGG